MAYLKTEKVQEVRKALSEAFPRKDGWKFSVTNENHMSLQVAIMESPIEWTNTDINHYYPEKSQYPEIVKKITEICMNGNHDNSDITTDYFDVGWYVGIRVGQWNKPYIFTGAK